MSWNGMNAPHCWEDLAALLFIAATSGSSEAAKPFLKRAGKIIVNLPLKDVYRAQFAAALKVEEMLTIHKREVL